MEEQNLFDFLEEKAFSDLKIGELDAIVKSLFDKRQEIEADEEKVSEKKKELEILKVKLLAILEAHGKKGYDSPFGKIEKREEPQVTWPKDPDKAKLTKQWCIEHGFDDSLTMNSRTFNSVYKAELESKKMEDESVDLDSIIPGVEKPTIRETLVMKKGK